MTREELREKTLNTFKSNNNIALQWATSVGKSRMAIDMINYYSENINSHSLTTVLLVVAEIAHKDNWYKEFNKWNLNFLEVSIVVECYASLKNYTNKQFDIIVLDEAHHIGSDIRLDILSTLKANKFILLSATLKSALMDNMEQLIGKIKSSKISLQEAIDNNWIVEPKIFTVPLRLDTKLHSQEIIEEWGKKDKRIIIRCDYSNRWTYLREKKGKYPNATLIISCTQFQKYLYLTEQLEWYKKKFFSCRNEVFKNKWLQLGSQRKRFLGECKTEYIKSFLDTIKDKRYICFCASIEQANYLGNNNAIHSEIPNRLDILNSFNNKEINNLFAVGMLQEGVNLNDIEVGVIVQLDGQERTFIQKFGKQICQYVSNSVEVI